MGSAAFAAGSAALDLLGGVFSYLASKDSAAISESRARMIRMESEAEAQRYKEQADNSIAQTKLAYVKAGVQLTGSPLDILAHDVLTARENVSAIRARGESQAMDQHIEGVNSLNKGRLALINGITSSIGSFAKGAYSAGKTSSMGGYDRKDLNSVGWGGDVGASYAGFA